MIEDHNDRMLEKYHEDQARRNPGTEIEPNGHIFKSSGILQNLGPYGRGDGSKLGTNDGWTALLAAAAAGHAEACALLLDRGADLAAKEDSGMTALHVVAAVGHAEACALLLDRGADLAAHRHHDEVHSRRREHRQDLL